MPRGKPCKFFDLTRRLLSERLALQLSGVTPSITDMRHLFYECRVKFLRENPSLSEPDSESKNLYVDWEKAVNNWCRTKTESFGYEEALYWRVRENLNIWAEGRAVCQGETGADPLLVEKKTRTRITENCHFILLCEKLTVSRELLERLQKKGYKVNLVSTRGHSPSDVQEAVLEVSEELSDKETPGFYILVLHDYDLEGIKIYLTLKERFDEAIDVGVDRELLEYLKTKGGFDERLVSEKVRYRNYRRKLRDEIALGESSYTLEDFDYLQGSLEEGKRWVGRRIEIDAIHVEYGIQPFIDYIEHQIETQCRYWDLSRVGVEPFELTEPGNYYHAAMKSFEEDVATAYGKKLGMLSKGLNEILGLVKKTLPQPVEYADLVSEHVGEKSRHLGAFENWKWTVSGGREPYSYEVREVTGVGGLEEKYEDQIGREWKESFEDGLEEVNEQITKYEGDVTKAEEDLQEQFGDLQDELDEAKKEDPDLEGFKQELETVDWGEEDLEDIPEPSLKAELEAVITTLQKRLGELGNEGARAE